MRLKASSTPTSRASAEARQHHSTPSPVVLLAGVRRRILRNRSATMALAGARHEVAEDSKNHRRRSRQAREGRKGRPHAQRRRRNRQGTRANRGRVGEARPPSAGQLIGEEALPHELAPWRAVAVTLQAGHLRPESRGLATYGDGRQKRQAADCRGYHRRPNPPRCPHARHPGVSTAAVTAPLPSSPARVRVAWRKSSACSRRACAVRRRRQR